MFTLAKIGLVGLVLLSSKMTNAEPCPAGTFLNEKTSRCTACPLGEYDDGMRKCLKCPDNKFSDMEGAKSVEECKGQVWRLDWQCGEGILNSLGQEAMCNPNLPHFCNEYGWCTKHEEDDDNTVKEAKKEKKDNTVKEAKKEKEDKDETDSDDDMTNTPSTTSDCQSVICIDFTSGLRYHPAHIAMAEIYKYVTKFVKEKEGKNGKNLYKGIALGDEKKKPKYAIWWNKGRWMVGDYDKRNTMTAFAFAQSDEECPEKINYDWRFYNSYDNAFKNAGEGMSVYGECKLG